MQGSGDETMNTLSATVKSENPNLVFLQECSNLPSLIKLSERRELPNNIIEGYYNFGTKTRPVEYFVYWRLWTLSDNGNNRCSVGFLIRKEDMNGGRILSTTVDNNARRPFIYFSKDGYNYVNIHATSGGRKNTLNYIEYVLRVFKNKKFILGGDFNFTPQQLQERNHQLNIYKLGETTQKSGNELDYFVSNTRYNNVTVKAGAYGNSDHRAVLIEIPK